MAELITSLLPLLLFIFIFSVLSNANKKKTTKAPGKRPAPPQQPPRGKTENVTKPHQPVKQKPAPIMTEEVHEGDDPCHPDPEYHEHIHDIPRETVTNDAPVFSDWQQSDIARAMIMHEILTHPWERKRKT